MEFLNQRACVPRQVEINQHNGESEPLYQLECLFGGRSQEHFGLPAAEDATQSVFIRLASTAPELRDDAALVAWLHRTTLLESKEWLRGELRRHRREQTAVELGTTMKTPDEQPALRALVPLLDDALLSLRERQILSYVSEGARNRQIASALTISEFTVKRHVQNILQKLELPSRRAAAGFYGTAFGPEDTALITPRTA